MFWTDLIHPNSKYVLGLPACGVTMHVSRRPSLLRKEAGLKVQLHRTSPRTQHMSSNLQTKQKLNQKDSLRKESGSKPQLHRKSPKPHHTSSRRNGRLPGISRLKQLHKISHQSIWLATLFWTTIWAVSIRNPIVKLECLLDPIVPAHIYIYVPGAPGPPLPPPRHGVHPPPPLWVWGLGTPRPPVGVRFGIWTSLLLTFELHHVKIKWNISFDCCSTDSFCSCHQILVNINDSGREWTAASEIPHPR